MRALRLGSYSMCATFAGTPSLLRRKSTIRYRRLLPPPWWRAVIRPCTLRPAFLRPLTTSDFSGVARVISSNDETLPPRRPGVVGLYLRTAIYPNPPSKISMASPSARVTIARFSSARFPLVYPRRLTLPRRFSVLTDVTVTSQMTCTACLISVLFARGSTRNVYVFCSIPAYDFSETIGRMITSRGDFIAPRPPHLRAHRWRRR